MKLVVALTLLSACEAGVTGPGEDPPDPIVPTPIPGCVESTVEPAASVDVVSVRSGRWSDPATWNAGRVPAAGDDVAIRRCHEVEYDVVSDAAIHTVLVNGRLEFARSVDTRLVAGIIAVSDDAAFDASAPSACTPRAHPYHPEGPPDPHMGTLSVGSAHDPIAREVRAEIRLQYFDDLEADCAPAILDHAGRMDFYGAPMDKTWVELGATAGAGATRIELAEEADWRVGDQVIVTATNDDGNGRSEDQSILRGNLEARTELRTITALDGRSVTLDAPLAFEHLGGMAASDLRGEVGNLSRNVIVESADPDGVRGHTMYHHGSSGSIHYAEFRHLGKEGELGRYAIHFHLMQDTMRGSSVIGASIWDSGNRWITIHGSEYLVVRDVVGYQSLGHGLFLEDASEVYNFFDHSLLVQSFDSVPIEGQVLAYDLNKGGCYWAANARNFVTDSTFVECDNEDSVILDYAPGDEDMPTSMLQPDGERRTVNANEVSGGLFDGIEVHSHRGWGPWIKGGRFPEDEPMLFRNTRVWNVHYSIDISGANVVFDGVEVADTSYGFYNLFPGPHVVRNAYMHEVSPHGAFMFYRGGGGTMFYEDFRTENCILTFRIDAINEPGPDGRPIVIHARNFEVVNPSFSDGGGGQTAHWVGTEDTNSRPDPIVMLVLHDLMGPDRDIVALPGNQSPSLPGVPEGLSFQNGSTMSDSRGVGFAGRGETLVAEASVPFPEDSPILHPVDRVPPATIVLSPAPGERVPVTGGTLVVRGVSLDQNRVSSVRVNGVEATLAPNGRDWSATLENVPNGGVAITAEATDDADNREAMPHTTYAWIYP